MRTSIFGVVLAGIVLGLAADTSRLSSQTSEPARNDNDVFADLARAAPGFAGVYSDASGETLIILIKDATEDRRDAAQKAVESLLAGGRPSASMRVEFETARYDFLELKEQYDRLRLDVLATPGVISTDIDEVRNRIRVGVETAAARARIEQAVSDLGAPDGMVDVEISSPIVLALADYRRPLVGGQKITGFLGCTLGLVGDRQGTRGFITNTHCSSQFCVQDGTAYYQPSSPPSSNLAGVETVDPPCNVGGACPSGKKCRDSESSFATVVGGVSSTRGQIARPPLNSSNWNGTDVFGVAGEQSNILVNDPVTKVGQGSGRTAGKVTATCVDVGLTIMGVNYIVWCTHRADYNSTFGDSGSPVFRIVNWPSQNDVSLYGMNFAFGGTNDSFFSSIGRIQFSSELGPIGFCAYGLSC